MSEIECRRGDIILVVLSGDYGNPRPGVVVQSDLFNESHASVALCPISSELTGLDLFRVAIPASPQTGLKRDSEIMIDKIVAARRDRIRCRIGKLSAQQMSLVSSALRLWLDLPPV